MANELANLKPAPGSTKKRTRRGRGEGSGLGKTSGRGQKGAGARSGGQTAPGFEGGQMPLHRRLPKRGFHNMFSKDYTVINVRDLNRFEAGTEVTAELLKSTGAISQLGKNGVKVLGNGDLAVSLTVKAAKFSKSAAEKIAAAGGTVELV
jgi:large subunit ribosomal protein L15